MKWKPRLRLVYNALLVATPYLLVLASFAAFLAWNGGIVVGDKQAHAATSHTPQVLYFSVFTVMLSWPFLFTDVHRHFSGMKSIVGVVLFAFLCLVCFLSFHFNTKVHKYLLADNRHYSFYVWKNVLSKPWSKYLLAPLAAFAARFISCSIRASLDFNFLSRLVLFTATAASLIFQELFDFRYFIIPYLVFRLHFGKVHGKFVFLEFLTYAAVNAVTIYIYTTKTFRWKDLREPQRIIW
jgi:alpha-1,2-glucosyltransferase